MHPSARVAGTSPCRGGFANGFHPKGSPARGAVGASRLRGAAPCPTNTFPGLAASLGLRDDASIVSYGRGAGPCRGLKDTCGSRRQCTPPPALRAPPLTGEAFGGRLSRWVGSCRRLAGRCQHRPLRMRGKGLSGFLGYLWSKAAMPPSVCALRRIHRPVCGARIARRALKHACALRPLRCREAAKTGAVSEGRSYVFYRRTGDNKRSDGRLPHEKQLSPPQAALDSAAPCRGGFWRAAFPVGW